MTRTPLLFRPLLGGLAGALMLFGPASSLRADVQISEFMAVNASVLQDEDLEYSDWIELYNSGPSTVDLTGWHLTDSKMNLTRWTFPATDLPAGGFLVVFASGKDRSGPELHANFSLSSSGEYLALVRPDGTTVEHEYAPTYPEQFSDISYGIQTQGTNPTLRAGEPGFLISHTPGSANTCLPAPHPLYSDDSVAQINLAISDDDWNWLHGGSPDTTSFRSVNVRFRHGDIDLTVTNAGIQCRGNTSLTQYPRSFNVVFNAFVPGQKLLDLERLNLNANVNDPSMARSKLVNDLHNAAGLPNPYANHVALVVSNSTYHYSYFDAVRDNTQPVDDVLLRQRFGTDRGNLYKCLYIGNPASLAYLGPTGTSYSAHSSTYELRYCGAGDSSYDDLAGFISQINLTPDTDFPNTIMSVFEVDEFLKNLALDVLTGHWDDYWINANNYHLFLNPETRRWTYIPYDFDNTFDIRWYDADWANQNIYAWTNIADGPHEAPLASRLMAVPEFKKRYAFYMKQILDNQFSCASMSALAFHCRSNMTTSLPFQDSGYTSNMKSSERDNYQWNWPGWSYDQFYYSYDYPQYDQNFNVPDKTGLLPFVTARAQSAYSQLGTVANIAPVLSDFTMDPSLPRTNDVIAVSIEAFDDVAVTNVSFYYSFNGGSTNVLEMPLQPDGSYATNLPAFGATGTVRYLVRALDNTGKSTYHPYGGSNYAATVEIGSAAFDLVVSEINYNPYPPTAAETAAGVTDAQNLEFVELYNAGNAPMVLAGFKLQDGVTATFPAFTLTNGTYAVAVKNTNQFRVRYTNAAIRVIGTISGNLSNGGETIRLENASGGVIAAIAYGDGGAWPGRADGDGSSLELIDPAFPAYADPSAWRSSSEYGGSPGSAGLGPDSLVVINEVLTHTDPPQSDTIELFNATESAIDISGWFLSDAKANYRKYAIPSNTVLSAGGYAVFDETNHFNTSGGTDTNDFSFDGAHGDEAFLLETDAQGHLVRFVDHVEFGAARNGESFGRWPNGTGRGVPMLSNTFGFANNGPRVGPIVIGEILYNPPSGSNFLEFVEISNPTASPVDLTHWQIDDGISLAFPSNTTLAAESALVVVSFDPNAASNSVLLASFRSTYGISTNVPLVGPYSGLLDGSGENICLLRPDEPPAEEPDYFPMLLEDEVGYDDEAPWPVEADGLGASLERILPAGWGDDFTSWIAADPPTPGAAGEPVATFDLTVLSAHGNPSPSVGSHAIVANTALSNSVPSPVVAGGFRFLCTGWTLADHDPASGSTNWMAMTLTNDATLAWLWSTQFLLAVSIDPGGSVMPASGWQATGALVELEAVASNDFVFVGWTGDTNAIVSGNPTSSTLSVQMDAPVSMTAHFEGIPVPSNTLTVLSAHGSPSPSIGAHSFATGTALSNSVPSPAVSGDVQYLCAGWTLENHDPASGFTNGMTMTLTNDATLAWLWSTQFLLAVSIDPGGSVQPAGGWHPPGATVELEAVASNLFVFSGWTGDTNAIVSGSPTSATLSVQMDAPVSMTAHFEFDLPTYYVSSSGSHVAPYTNWATASTSLPVIVDYVPSGSTVLVAAATYALTNQLTLDKALHLKSAEGPANTYLYGNYVGRVLYLSHADAVVEGFSIFGGDSGNNSGGGVRIEPAGRLVNCILFSNFTDKSGGGVALIGAGELRNCLFHDNYAQNERGGGLYTYCEEGSAPLIENCTFSTNYAHDGGGVYLNESATLRNSIVWGNMAFGQGPNIVLFGSGHIVESTLTNASPLFVDARNGDFRLATNSPCIDAATNQPWMAEAIDLDGRPRVIHDRADIGAYEAILEFWDTDADGLPDGWEWKHSRTLTGMDPNANDDSDHMTNLQECFAGTDPFDGASFLGIGSAVLDEDPNQFVMSWSSATGRSYRIGFSTNLFEGFPFAAYSNIPADPPTNTFPVTRADPGPAFYRIELE